MGAPTDDERISNLKEVVDHHYGEGYVGGGFYDSECVKSANPPSHCAGGVPGGLNDRSWRFQKCSELGYLQPAPTNATAMRSKHLTLQALLDQCDYCFGDGQADALKENNAKFRTSLEETILPAANLEHQTSCFLTILMIPGRGHLLHKLSMSLYLSVSQLVMGVAIADQVFHLTSTSVPISARSSSRRCFREHVFLCTQRLLSRNSRDDDISEFSALCSPQGLSQPVSTESKRSVQLCCSHLCK